MTHSRTVDAYVGNADTAAAARWIEAHDRFVITTHLKPDGDAIGTSLALARAIRLAKPRATIEVWYAGVLPDFLDEVRQQESIVHIDKQGVPEVHPDTAFVIVDTGAVSQIAPVLAAIEGHPKRTLIIDHHLSGEPHLADLRLIDTTAAAAAQIAAGVCSLLLAKPTTELPLLVASMLYMGIATDTGWFRFSNVTPHTMRLAADLIQSGVDHTVLYGLIEQQDHPGRLRLLGRALTTLELYPLEGCDNCLALMGITRDDYQTAGARPGDTGGFADKPLTIASVRVSIFLNQALDEQGNTVTKFSMRSKPGPNAIDVNAIALQLGGGGHARAAGARIQGSLDEAKAKLLAVLGVDDTTDCASP